MTVLDAPSAPEIVTSLAVLILIVVLSLFKVTTEFVIESLLFPTFIASVPVASISIISLLYKIGVLLLSTTIGAVIVCANIELELIIKTIVDNESNLILIFMIFFSLQCGNSYPCYFLKKYIRDLQHYYVITISCKLN